MFTWTHQIYQLVVREATQEDFSQDFLPREGNPSKLNVNTTIAYVILKLATASAAET